MGFRFNFRRNEPDWGAIPPFDKKTLGFHVNPCSITGSPGNWPGELTEDDFKRISDMATFVVSNFWPQWWRNPVWRPRMEWFMDMCAKYELKLIVRTDDPSLTVDWKDAATARNYSPEWIAQDHEPFLRDLLTVGRERIWGVQHQNEIRVDGVEVRDRFGNPLISPHEYLSVMDQERQVVALVGKEIGCTFRFSMTSVTTFVSGVNDGGTRYYDWLNQLLDCGILTRVKHGNLHWYDNPRISALHKERAKAVAERFSNTPVWFTEVNHKDRKASPAEKLKALKAIWQVVNEHFDVECFCPFCWNPDVGYLLGWAVRGTELETMIRENVQ